MNLKDKTGVIHTPQEGLEENAVFQLLKEAGFDMSLVSKCGSAINSVVLSEEPVSCLKRLATS